MSNETYIVILGSLGVVALIGAFIWWLLDPNPHRARIADEPSAYHRQQQRHKHDSFS